MMLLFVIVSQLRKYEEWMVVGIWLAIGNLHLDVFSGVFHLFAPGGVQAVCCAHAGPIVSIGCCALASRDLRLVW
jgi:hypothetical protein